MENELDYYLSDAFRKLTHQQQRFCDNYLTHFNAFKAAVDAGYSENTSRKGALLHVPKIQQYLQDRMAERGRRLEITHDMLLRELSKIAFSNMGNYYDEHACLKKVNELTVDEKAAIAFYDIIDVQDADGHYIGTRSKIKLHNKMAALDRIARHVGFYGVLSGKQEARSRKFSPESGVLSRKPDVGGLERDVVGDERDARTGGNPDRYRDVSGGAQGPFQETLRGRKELVVVDRSRDDLPMDYPVEDFELTGIDLKTLAALGDVDAGPGVCWRDVEDEGFEEVAVGTESLEEVAAAVAVAVGSGSGVLSRDPGSAMSGSSERGMPGRGLESEAVVGHKRDACASTKEDGEEIVENILTISPLPVSGSCRRQKEEIRVKDLNIVWEREFALGIGVESPEPPILHRDEDL